MDELRPDDIVGYRFKRDLRGYAVDEVDRFLARIADQLERTAAEIEDLRGRLEVAEAQAAATRETEATLQRTLVVAQQAAERNLAEADAKAEAALAGASAEAERVRREAGQDASRLRTEAEEEAARLRTDAQRRATTVLEEAQEAARREVLAARDRVQDAADRHAEVVRRVAEHRDALRAQLSHLEELAIEAPPRPRTELVAGELPDGPAAGDAVPAPPLPLTVRVHEEHEEGTSDEVAPLGSAPYDRE